MWGVFHFGSINIPLDFPLNPIKLMVERLLFLLFLLIPMQFLNPYILVDLQYNSLNFRVNFASNPVWLMVKPPFWFNVSHT